MNKKNERFSQEYYRCGCCNQEFSASEAVQKHFKTDKHKETAILALMKEDQGNGLEIYLDSTWRNKHGH